MASLITLVVLAVAFVTNVHAWTPLHAAGVLGGRVAQLHSGRITHRPCMEPQECEVEEVCKARARKRGGFFSRHFSYVTLRAPSLFAG